MFEGEIYGAKAEDITPELLRAAPRDSVKYANFMSGACLALKLITERRDKFIADRREEYLLLFDIDLEKDDFEELELDKGDKENE